MKVIALDSNERDAEDVFHKLQRLVEIEETAVAWAASEIIQHFMDCEFGLCLVSEDFSANNFMALLEDLEKAGKAEGSVFIQIRRELEPDFDRESLLMWGFQTVITRDVDSDDETVLRKALAEPIRRGEVGKRRERLQMSLDSLLQEVDRVAAARKHGVDVGLNTAAGTLTSSDLSFDEEVMDSYFESLSDKAALAKPSEDIQIAIPQEILLKELPNLTEDGYKGVSRRVFEKLAKRWSAQEHASAKAPDDEASEATPKSTEAEETTPEDSAS